MNAATDGERPQNTVSTRGVPQIIAYEAAERFSFYGMLSALPVVMSTSMAPAASEAQAGAYLTLLGLAVYCLSFAGAIIAEAFLGKFRTIIAFSIVYCVGYGALIFVETGWARSAGQWPILAFSVGLIAAGSGAVKPCIAAHLGDQFTEANRRLLPAAFGWFYFFIHAAPLVAVGLCQYLIATSGYGLRGALAVPIVAAAVGTMLFWSARKKFVHVSPFGRPFVAQILSREGMAALGRLLGLYVFVALFWVVWQRGTEAWARQAGGMELRFAGIELLPQQMPTANIVLLLLLIPTLSYAVYPLAGRLFAVTPLRKIGAGLFVTGLSFAIASGIQHAIDAGARPSVGWQLGAWALLTLGEAMVIITALELSYVWAPEKMKSFVMSLWLLTYCARDISAGTPPATSKMSDFNSYVVFALLMFVATAIFAVIAKFYPYRTYLQSQDEPVDKDVVLPDVAGGTPT